MQQIFVNEDALEFNNGEKRVCITGQDAHHLSNVIRIQPGETLRVSISNGENYLASVIEVSKEQVLVKIDQEAAFTELNNKIYLFQALPKGDRMDTIIEKCVELGVYEIIPVEMKYCVVKLDDKKKAKKLDRYQTIAETAAKQSKRSIIPQIHEVMSYKDAIEYARQCDLNLVPYENKDGMISTRQALSKIKDGQAISIIIGPEGGFAPEEIDMVRDMDIISLGSRILRTDTAAITTTSMVMVQSELNQA